MLYQNTLYQKRLKIHTGADGPGTQEWASVMDSSGFETAYLYLQITKPTYLPLDQTRLTACLIYIVMLVIFAALNNRSYFTDFSYCEVNVLHWIFVLIIHKNSELNWPNHFRLRFAFHLALKASHVFFNRLVICECSYEGRRTEQFCQWQ